MSLITFRSSITQEEWNLVNQEFQIIRATVNNRVSNLQNVAVDAVNALANGPNKTNLIASVQVAQNIAKLLAASGKELKKLIADLANKIAT
jgi:hypothetical protein